MEPMVVFGVALVLYCGWLTCCDFSVDRRRGRTVRTAPPRPAPVRRRAVSRAAGRADGAAARWREPARDSA